MVSTSSARRCLVQLATEATSYTERGRAAFAASRRVIERIEREYSERLGRREYERLKRSLRE